MTLNIYVNESRDNQRNKNITLLTSLTGSLREGSSIINPVIKISGALPANANYFYVPEFGRYYFITDIISLHNNLFEIHGHTDVLSSAGAGLDDCTGIVRRQENNWNLYLDDGAFKAYSNPNVVQKAFPSGFSTSNMCYILAVAGS